MGHAPGRAKTLPGRARQRTAALGNMRARKHWRLSFMTVVTRFAPSPTGMLHSAASARRCSAGCTRAALAARFILRVEDTDRERSTDEAVRVILDGMAWLGLAQTRVRITRPSASIATAKSSARCWTPGSAYHCYCTKEELDAMREQQIARKEKPRYTGICRERTAPRPGVSRSCASAIRSTGAVVVEDLVHGPVTFQNAELDDLIIARSDGTPTYNFCVVVDDMRHGRHACHSRR